MEEYAVTFLIGGIMLLATAWLPPAALDHAGEGAGSRADHQVLAEFFCWEAKVLHAKHLYFRELATVTSTAVVRMTTGYGGETCAWRAGTPKGRKRMPGMRKNIELEHGLCRLTRFEVAAAFLAVPVSPQRLM